MGFFLWDKQPRTIQSRMFGAFAYINYIAVDISSNNKQRIFMCNIQSFSLSNSIIMGAAMFANDFSTPWFIRERRTKFPEVLFRFLDVLFLRDKFSRNFNHIAGFGFKLLLKKRLANQLSRQNKYLASLCVRRLAGSADGQFRALQAFSRCPIGNMAFDS